MTRILKGRSVLKRGYLHALETSEEVIAEARARGHAEGMARAAAALAEAEMLRGRWLVRARSELAELAVEVATALAGRAFSEDPALVGDLCAQALERVTGGSRITVRISPADAGALGPVAGRMDLTIVEDEGITAGGCIVESDLGTVDATMETRTGTLRDALEEVVARHAEEGD